MTAVVVGSGAWLAIFLQWFGIPHSGHATITVCLKDHLCDIGQPRVLQLPGGDSVRGLPVFFDSEAYGANIDFFIRAAEPL